MPKRRDAGTYYTLDKERFDALLLTMPAKQGILLYLELKRNYTNDGATVGELLEVLGKSAGMIENTLYRLLKTGEVERRNGRIYPGSFHTFVEESVEKEGVSTKVSTDPSTKASTDLWKTPPKYTVLDAPSDSLKEVEGNRSKNQNIDPPTPQEKKGEAKSGFDPTGLELPNFLEPQVWADWCAHRSEIKKPLTPTTAKQQLALLSKTPEDANAVVTQSIERGWVGLFPLKENRARAGGSSRRGVKKSTSDYGEDVSMDELLDGPLEGNWGRDG